MRGIPYSAEELAAASKQPPDEYHRELMKWAAKEIQRLQAKLDKAKVNSA